MKAPPAIALTWALSAFPGIASGQSAATAADSVSSVVANRVVLDIAAPPTLIWSFLPGLRKRPNMEVVSQNGLRDQFGSRFDTIYRDSTGKVTRHDRIEVLHWEPGVRYVAFVTYLPPAPPLTIVYNVDLRDQGGTTHFVMDSYATIRLPGGGTEAERVARLAAQRQEFQTAVVKGYETFKTEVEAAARSATKQPNGLSNARGVSPADHEFMAGMIPHHAQAVKIAQWAATHGARSDIRILAERIVVAQRDEIALMRTWLADRGLPVPASDATHHRMSMNGSTHDMLMPGMLTDQELAELDQARGAAFDRLFLSYMIRHHEGALTMVNKLLASDGAGQDEVVFRFASDVFADQTTEIDRMDNLLATLSQASEPSR